MITFTSSLSFNQTLVAKGYKFERTNDDDVVSKEGRERERREDGTRNDWSVSSSSFDFINSLLSSLFFAFLSLCIASSCELRMHFCFLHLFYLCPLNATCFSLRVFPKPVEVVSHYYQRHNYFLIPFLRFNGTK